MKSLFFLLTLALLFPFAISAKSKNIKSGFWYSTLNLGDHSYLPFITEIKSNNNKSTFCIFNGSERILLNNVETKNDSIFIVFPAFDSEIKAQIINKKTLKGRWYNHAKKGNYSIPFQSNYELKTKYPVEEPSIQVSGRWEVTFSYHTKASYKAIGLFQNEVMKSFEGEDISNRITGTFMTETGDYRFLEGATLADSLFLSTFDGSHAFLFNAHLKEDTLWGEFLSGTHYQDKWFAVRNESFELTDPDSLTYITSEESIAFSLPATDGSTFNYPSDADKGKVTLIQITGTWCPNCLDESIFLKKIVEDYEADLQVISVTFETQKTLEGKLNKVKTYQENLNLPYTFLIGGDACKPCAAEVFPMLNEVISFPTLIFIDRKGEVRKIHTGFNGPGTGDYYDQFQQSTREFLDLLIREKI